MQKINHIAKRGPRLDAAIDFTLLLQHIVVYDIMMQIFLQRFVVTCAAFGRLHGATIRYTKKRHYATKAHYEPITLQKILLCFCPRICILVRSLAASSESNINSVNIIPPRLSEARLGGPRIRGGS